MKAMLEFLAKAGRVDVIGYLVREGYVTPAIGRAIEILTLGTIAAALGSILEYWLNGGTGVEKTVTVALTAGMAYATKSLRERAIKRAEELAKEAEAARAEFTQ